MINDSDTINHCEPCQSKVASVKKKERAGLITGIFLAVLPKCPFCLLAYSSATMLYANGAGMHEHGTSSTTLIIAAIFCVIAIGSILLNYRDSRTKYAIGLAVSGSAAIIFSVTVSGGEPLYYTGIILLFAGVWLNASLLSVIKKIKNRFIHVSDS